MPLSATAVLNAKPRAKAYKLADERGLFLFVTPKGQKYWRLKYRFEGKEKKLAFGVYPDVTLADARAKRDAARRIAAAGEDPAARKQEEQARQQANIFQSFQLGVAVRIPPL
jgi:Arm DNA-binding domain